jgi:hypothetical protein
MVQAISEAIISRARVPRQVVVGNNMRQGIARQVMMLVRPSRGVGNLIGKRRGRENLGLSAASKAHL